MKDNYILNDYKSSFVKQNYLSTYYISHNEINYFELLQKYYEFEWENNNITFEIIMNKLYDDSIFFDNLVFSEIGYVYEKIKNKCLKMTNCLISKKIFSTLFLLVHIFKKISNNKKNKSMLSDQYSLITIDDLVLDLEYNGKTIFESSVYNKIKKIDLSNNALVEELLNIIDRDFIFNMFNTIKKNIKNKKGLKNILFKYIITIYLIFIK